MALSQGAVFASAYPGLTLRAWALVTAGVGPVIHQSFNVSGVVRTGAGTFTVTFASALPSANYLVDTGVDGGDTYATSEGISRTTASVGVAFRDALNGALLDPGLVYIAVYG